MRDHDDLPTEFWEVFVVDPTHKPVGTCQLSWILRTPRQIALVDVMKRDQTLIPVTMDQEEVALRFQKYALISAGASIVGRFLTGTTAGSLIEWMGYVNFYLLTTLAAVPGIVLFWWMMRTGLVDAAMGTAGEVGEGDARADLGSTSYPYTVAPGDTMSALAERFLGNRLKSYQLARYNGLDDPAALRRGDDAVTAVVRDRWSGLRRRGRRVEVAPAGADAAAVAGDVGVLLVIAEAAVALVDDAGRAADRTRRALASLDEALAATATATWLARATRDARPEVAFGAGVVAARQRQAGRAVGETWSDRWAAVSKRSTWRWAR